MTRLILGSILLGLPTLSVSLWAVFDYTWWVPVSDDLPRGIVLIALHVISGGTGFSLIWDWAYDRGWLFVDSGD